MKPVNVEVGNRPSYTNSDDFIEGNFRNDEALLQEISFSALARTYQYMILISRLMPGGGEPERRRHDDRRPDAYYIWHHRRFIGIFGTFILSAYADVGVHYCSHTHENEITIGRDAYDQMGWH